MKKNSITAIVFFLSISLPLFALLLFPGALPALRRISSLSGETPLFTVLVSLSLILFYLSYRFIYSGKLFRDQLELSASTLLIHLLAQIIFLISVLGISGVYLLQDLQSAGTIVSLLTVLFSVVHIVFTLPLFEANNKSQISRVQLYLNQEVYPGVIASVVLSGVMILFGGIILPSFRIAAVILSAGLLWEALYLFIGQKAVFKFLSK